MNPFPRKAVWALAYPKFGEWGGGEGGWNELPFSPRTSWIKDSGEWSHNWNDRMTTLPKFCQLPSGCIQNVYIAGLDVFCHSTFRQTMARVFWDFSMRHTQLYGKKNIEKKNLKSIAVFVCSDWIVGPVMERAIIFDSVAFSRALVSSYITLQHPIYRANNLQADTWLSSIN
jgi:hypothetical protein